MSTTKTATSYKLSLGVENGVNALGAAQVKSVSMEKTLELIFTKSDGAKKTLSIADPREGLTLAAAKTAADKIIAANVLTSGGLELTEFTEARIKTVIIDVLA